MYWYEPFRFCVFISFEVGNSGRGQTHWDLKERKGDPTTGSVAETVFFLLFSVSFLVIWKWNEIGVKEGVVVSWYSPSGEAIGRRCVQISLSAERRGSREGGNWSGLSFLRILCFCQAFHALYITLNANLSFCLHRWGVHTYIHTYIHTSVGCWCLSPKSNQIDGRKRFDEHHH